MSPKPKMNSFDTLTMASSKSELDSSVPDFLIDTLKRGKDKIGIDPIFNAAVKLLVEIRESARRNGNFETYNHITKSLDEELSIELRE
jgi:hypothetical protein